jgi:Zn-dependent M28 family amino/carboxypeptidase
MKYSPGWLALAGAVSVVLALGAQAAPQAKGEDLTARGKRAWEDVKVLADDKMEGRRAGTPAHRRAAEYVAKQFAAAGLSPGGEGGWFQKVNLESRTVREDVSRLALVTDQGTEPLELGADAILFLRGNVVPSVDAPLVFVGNGLRLPRYGHDDLEGLDLKGKVVVYFNSAPRSVPGAAGAHFGSANERWKQYRAAGAVGILAIPNPFAMDLPWERIAAQRNEPQMRLAPPAVDLYPDLQVYAALNPARFSRLLEGTGVDGKSVLDKLEKGEAMPHFDLKARLRATIAATSTMAVSDNVLGVLKGSDPGLGGEFVVLSAHLDHLGILDSGTGDRLNNGAMDNASGVAVLLDVARHLRSSTAKPRRSLVFAAVTAEELGGLGSRAYAEQPGKGVNVIADVNSDMFLPLYPMKHLLVFGLDESTLGDDARAVAGELGLVVQADPQPQRNRFIRSDQYSFVRVGVPALALKVGYLPDSPEAKIDAQWFKERYHAPSDDLNQPVDFGAIGTYAEVMQRLALRIANAPQVPAWKPESVFGTIPRKAPAP